MASTPKARPLKTRVRALAIRALAAARADDAARRLVRAARPALRRARLRTARARAVARYRDAMERGELRVAWHEGRPVLARPTRDVTVAQVMLANLRLVVDTLTAADVECFSVPGGPDRYRIGIPRGRARDALAAFERLGDPTLAITPADPDAKAVGRPIGPSMTNRDRGRAVRSRVWRVYRHHCDPRGLVVIGHMHGCEVEFWDSAREADGTESYTSTLWNKRATIAAPTSTTGATIEIGGIVLPTIEDPAEAPPFDEIDFPVDIVYTWVDGNDPAWAERKNAVLRQLHPERYSADSADVSRYANRDELKYSLRSVWMFADFVRQIFIVTDEQVPSWLDIDHPQITLVGHKEIFGEAGRLPSFNSHAIESRLHHINGLAEHYVYLNDDFFFGRRVTAERFFHSNGLSKFFLSNALMGLGKASTRVESVTAAARNSRSLIAQRFGRSVHQKFKHAPYPQRRSVIFEMEEAFSKEFERTAAAQVRGTTDIPVASSLYHYYAYLTGRAVPSKIDSRYAALADPDFADQLEALRRARNFDSLCVNDTVGDDPRVTRRNERALETFLESYYPVPSPYERGR